MPVTRPPRAIARPAAIAGSRVAAHPDPQHLQPGQMRVGVFL